MARLRSAARCADGLAALAALLLAAACAGSTAPSLEVGYERELGRGDLALRMGFPADAADHYRSALALRPGDPPALLGLARAYVAAGEGEAALAALARLERSDPAWVHERAGGEMRQAMMLAARSRLRRGDSAGALQLLRRLREIAPDYPDLQRTLVDVGFAEAGRLQVAGRPEAAAALLREVGHAAPEGDVAFALAVGLMDRGRVNLAISVLSDAITLRPADVRLVALMDRALRIRYPNGLPD